MRARAEAATADFTLAARLLDQADRHLESAAIVGVDPQGRFTLLYDAARKAADAVLRAEVGGSRTAWVITLPTLRKPNGCSGRRMTIC